MFCNVHKRTACDRGENTVRLRSDNLVVLCNEQEVSTACFLNLCASCGVKIHILVKALCVSSNNCVKAHSIVKTGLDVTCAVRSGSVKVGNLNCNRLCTALEVRANRSCENSELIFVRRFYADNRT